MPYLRRLKALAPSTFCVLFKDPRTRRHGADLLIVQQHDAPRGSDVLVVTTAPNRLLPERLAEAHATFAATLAPLPEPRTAVLVGGNGRHHRFTDADIDRFLRGLEARLEDGSGLMITTSRRTPTPLAKALAGLGNRPGVHLWDGTGKNPLLAYLAWADEIVVTADSTNMVGEAAALGVPIQLFYPSGGHPKIDSMIAALSQEAVIGRFPEEAAHGRGNPVNSTPGLAEEILKRWQVSKARPARPS